MDVAFATDASTAGALSSAFPQLDLSAFGFSSPAPELGAGGALPLSGALDFAGDHDTFEEDDRMPVGLEDDGAHRGAELHGTDRFDEADADQIPLGPNGTPGQASVFLSAEDVHGAAAEGEQDAGLALGTAVGDFLPETPEAVVVPELPSEGACLRATHLRSEMPSDAGLDAVQTACKGLGHVVSDVMPSATVLCTAVDDATGAPVDYSVQIFTQRGHDGLVMEVQHAGRGDRLAFNTIYASVADQLRAEAGCGASLEAAAPPRTPSEPLGPPRALSSRAVTLGAVSAPLGAPARLGETDHAAERPASADAAVPGGAGLRILASRLNSASGSDCGSDDGAAPAALVPDASESAETAAAIADRLRSMDGPSLAATVGALDGAAIPAALVSVLVAAAASAETEAASASLAADDSTVVPVLVALCRLLACPGEGCGTLTGTGPAALEAIRALSQTAKAASLQHEDASRDLAAAAAARRTAARDGPLSASLPLSDTHCAPLAPSRSAGPPLAATGDGPAASSAPWLATSGAVLRLRATAAALRAAASREGPAPEGASPSGRPGCTWSALVAEAAAEGIASLVSAAATLKDAELSDSVNWLQGAGRR